MSSWQPKAAPLPIVGKILEFLPPSKGPAKTATPHPHFEGQETPEAVRERLKYFSFTRALYSSKVFLSNFFRDRSLFFEHKP